jgi:hypothetical protein
MLTPVTTVQLFRLQIPHGNIACSHPPCRACCLERRRTVKLAPESHCVFFELLLERFGNAVQRSALDEGRMHGHRTFAVITFNLEDRLCAGTVKSAWLSSSPSGPCE